ncbi:MAG: GvpL/GvpF family gas vesicle protein [Proteobacteria bacterium]|nr:GvpL/GvpF family gas vesicle protein [Pseudomonadota bacterium]
MIPRADEATFGDMGIDGARVGTITEGPLSAVVSETGLKRIKPKRRHVTAHQRVLQKLMEERAVLPVSFGVVADSAEAIRGLLFRHQDELCGELERVGDKVEMTLRVNWDVPNVFEYLVHRHSELREMRDRLWGAGNQPTRAEMIEVGKAFESLLEEDRERSLAVVKQVLTERGVTIERNGIQDEREVMNLSCLVPQAQHEEFEEAVVAAASHFDQHYSFDYSGPWPPYSFVHLDLQSNHINEVV